MTTTPTIQALVFDVFGTVVDWRTSLITQCEAFGRERTLTADWPALVDAWRAAYHPAMDGVRGGVRAWAVLDTLHRESLDALLPQFGLDHLGDADRHWLTLGWHRLDPWPDAVPGLARLKQQYVIATLSNGGVALLVNMAKRAGLPWDAVLSAELFRRYKPDPAVYVGAAELLGQPPQRVMMVAAHNNDLAAAQACGLRTAFVTRPTEYGAAQTRDLAPSGEWDIVAPDFHQLADQLLASCAT